MTTTHEFEAGAVLKYRQTTAVPGAAALIPANTARGFLLLTRANSPGGVLPAAGAFLTTKTG